MARVRILLVSFSSHVQSPFGLRGLARHSWTTGCRFSSSDSRASLSRVRPNLFQLTRKPPSVNNGYCIHTGRRSDSNIPRKNENSSTLTPTEQATNKPNSNVSSVATPITKLSTTLKTKLKLDSVRRERIYNLPNFLTLSRVLATPALGYLIIHNQHLYAFALFAYAAVSDLLDGWIARKWHLQTVVGSVVDPMADKFLMTTLVTCLAVNGSLSMPLFVLILGRDLSLTVSAFYYRYASLPTPKTMARYWDFSLPSAEVHPTTISKLNTFLQLSLLGTLLCTNLLHDPSATSSVAGDLLLSIQDLLGGEQGVKVMIQGISAVVASTTVYSGLEYTWSKKAVVILGGDEVLKRKQGFRGRMIMASGFGSFIALAMWLWYKETWLEKDEHGEK